MATLPFDTLPDGAPTVNAGARQPAPLLPRPAALVERKPGDPEVEATFVFIDAVKHGIEGLTVRMEGGGKIEIATTDKDGTAATWTDAKRGEPIKVYVKKRNGDFDLKGSVTPKLDVNN